MSKKNRTALLDLPDVSSLKDALSKVDDDFDSQIAELEAKRKTAKDKEMGSLKEQRGQLASQRNEIDIAIQKLDKLIQGLGGKVGKTGGSKRGRRSAEQITADAEALVAYLQKHPKSGGAAIKAETNIDWGLSLKDFIEKNTSAKVKTEGSKRSMVYSV